MSKESCLDRNGSAPLVSCRATLIAVLILMLQAAALMGQTGGGATLVGTVKDSSGSVVAGAKIKVVNTETSFLTETTTQPDGSYYVPYLTPGNYRVTVNAPGFKEFVRDGLTMRSAEVPRVDIVLEVGGVTESVTVNAAASLLNTENVVSAYVVPAEVLKEQSGVMKRTLYTLQYMPGVVGVLGQAGFHITGQAQNDIGASLDGVTSKSPYTGVVNQVDGVVQASMDAMEEVKVLTTGVSAEYGHTSGGSMKMVYKSGTNSLHGSFDDRYLPGNWTHRAYLTQFPTPAERPVVLRNLRPGRQRPGGHSETLQRKKQDLLVVRLRHQPRAHHQLPAKHRADRGDAQRRFLVSRSRRRRAADLQSVFRPPGERHLDGRSPARQYRAEEPDGSRRDEVPVARNLAEAQRSRHARAGPARPTT